MLRWTRRTISGRLRDAAEADPARRIACNRHGFRNVRRRAGRRSQPRCASCCAARQHRAFVGWQFGDGTFTSMRVTGNITDEKGDATSTFVMLSKGLVYHNSYTATDLGNLTTHTGFTGNLFWHADVNGFTTPVYGGYAKYLASFTVLQQEGTTELPASFRQRRRSMGNRSASCA